MDASKRAAVALALPGCLLTAGAVVVLVMAAFGRNPMWSHQPMNIAEAAGTRDEAEVALLIEQGWDANVRYAVRAGFLFSTPTLLTPLEAAIAADDPIIVQQLLRGRGPLDAERWNYLACISDGNDVPPILQQRRPQGAQMLCDGVRPPWPLGDE